MLDDLICLMYRNISSRYTLCRRNQENQLMVFVPRLESNRWWIYLSFQSSTFRPFRAFSPSKRSKVTIVIQPIHDSRFTSVLPPFSSSTDRSSNDTQFPRSSCFFSAASNRDLPPSPSLLLWSRPRGDLSVVRLQCEPQIESTRVIYDTSIVILRRIIEEALSRRRSRVSFVREAETPLTILY